ncbi:hypothetical protein KXX35_008862, partial [Aspergillus fumigatus]
MALLTIGVDLGEAFSSVAVFRNGRVDIIQDSHGRKKFPIADLLRSEGNGPRQDQGSSLDNADNSALIHQDHITTILSKIKSLAESYLHEPVEHAVITVPVSYGDLE